MIEKTNCLLDAVKNQLQNAISNIDAGNSNLNEEEMEELVKTLSVLNKGVKRISKAYACEHILHCSPALNAQYHDNIELYKEWFGEDNIENIKDKIIESAIVNWFEDEDAGIEKVWNYFRAI